jgi:hypothetical protein
MDTRELMELDEASLLSYIEDHIRENGRNSIVRAVAIDSNGDSDSSNDTDSPESGDESAASDSSDDNGYESNNEDQAIENQALPILDRERVHDPVVHHNVHCPPFNDMLTVFSGNPHGICDCDDFCFAMCAQDNDFEYFKTAHYVIAFDELLVKAMENVDSQDRRSNNELRKSLYKKIFCALDFGVLEPGERRRLPNCAVAKVRQIYPSETGYYMGFKEK